MTDDTKRRPRRDRPPALDLSNAPEQGTFTVQGAARVTSIPARSINFWTGPARVLKPDHAYRGRGSAKRFSPRNLVQLRVIHLLALRGESLSTMRALMAQAEHSRGFGDDWFELPSGRTAHPARLREEFLTCAHAEHWRRWNFPPGALGFLEKLAPPARPRGRRKPMSPVAGLAYFGGGPDYEERQAREFVRELLDGEDIVVVNLGRIKADVMARLGPSRP